MKKILSLISLFVLFSISASAEQYIYSKGKCNQIINGKQTSVEYELQYDDSNGDIWFIRNVGKSFTAFLISKSNMQNVRNAVSKYFEWEKIAVENQKTIQKDIADLNFESQEIMSVYGQNRNNKVDIYFTFFSQTVKSHQFVIRGKKRTGNMEDYYFSKAQAEEFSKLISEDSISEFKNRLSAQKQKENDLFN